MISCEGSEIWEEVSLQALILPFKPLKDASSGFFSG